MIVALSAPSVSAPVAPLVVPIPVMTLPVCAVKVAAGTLSVSLRAVGASSATLMVSAAVATSPSRSVTATTKVSATVPPMRLSVSVKLMPMVPATGSKLVIVNTPRGLVKVCPVPVKTVPLMVIPASPSGELNTIVPVVVSVLAAALLPAGSLPLAGRPGSPTVAVALVAPVGWSTVMMTAVGSRSSGWGMISSSTRAGKASAVGGSRSPRPKASWIGPAGSKKLPPELRRLPAAGSTGPWPMVSSPISSAARLSGGTATPSMTISGTNTAPSGMMNTCPLSSRITRSRPWTSRSSSVTPGGRTTTPSGPATSGTAPLRATEAASAASSETIRASSPGSGLVIPLVFAPRPVSPTPSSLTGVFS